MQSILKSSRRPDLAFSRSGRIDIFARAVHILALKPGDVIDIAFDSKHREWYLYVKYRAAQRIGRHEATCYATSRHGGTFRTHSAGICSYIFSLHGTSQETIRLTCGQPVTYQDRTMLPIILHHAL